MAVGDVGAVDRIAKQDRRAQRAARNIERRLSRKRGGATARRSVAATRPTRFSIKGLSTPGRLLVENVTRRLISTRVKEEGRHAFFAATVCDECGVLVAPKREGASLCMAIHEATVANPSATAQVIDAPAPCFGPALVPLLQSSESIDAKLFTNSNGMADSGDRIGVARTVVGKVCVFSLHAMNADSPEAKPTALDLSSIDFSRMQQEATRLLGLRLLSQWTL